MDISLDGYRFDRRLRCSAVTEVWSAVRERDELPVVAKVFSIEDRPGLEARVEHEFDLIRRLDVPGVVRALDCVRSGRQLFLLLEAHAGVNLAEFSNGRPLDLDTFFAIACPLTAILAQVHAQRVIHRDIKPTNVLVGEDGHDVLLADFGISVLLESERIHIHDPAIMGGTLPYTSPEQTGRTGREVDFRSDLYSLGVTFYELLTGRRPFVADSSLELIHAHLARRPESPRRLRPELPAALSALVMKLLEKAPERRYQSARGLVSDLEQMRDALAAGELVADFELGRADVPLTLQLPHQLYGREQQHKSLSAAFRRSLTGASAFVIVVGEAGVGKSALLDELAAEVIRHGGRLIHGAFEAGRDEPLFGLSVALTKLAEQLLTETVGELERRRAQLREQLGPLCAVLCELVPRFHALLGEPEDEPVGSDSESARNRVRQACVRLLETMAEPEQPLVLALDDMQWADAATLDVLDSLSASSRRGILVALSTRPGALEPAGVLASLVTKLEHHGHPRERCVIELEPLDAAQLREMLADTLSLTPEIVAPLAAVVERKTGGNPFFVRQFLRYLSEQDLLRREPEGWTWAIEELTRAALPADALEMMSRKLGRLDPPMRELILAAAVLGGEVEPELLGRLVELDEVASQLMLLADEGLLAAGPEGGFVFAHGRIREAAYAMLDEVRRRRWHRAAAEALLASLDEAALERRLFDVVEHLDRGYGLWPDGEDQGPEELSDARRVELARLNLRAGRRALATGVSASAKIYLSVASGLLPERDELPPCIDPLHELHVEVHLNLAMAEAVTQEAQRADLRLARLLTGELSTIERGEVATARVTAAISDTRLEDAVDIAFEVLPVLGVDVPRSPSGLDVARVLPRLLWMVRPAGLEHLRELRPLHEPRIEVVMELLTALAPASFMCSPALFVVLVATQAELTLRHGRHRSTPIVFGQIGLVLANALGRRRQAVELSALCAELAEGSPVAHRVGLLGLFVRVWVEPLLNLLERADHLLEVALAQGDLNTAVILKSNCVSYACYGGLHLRLLEARVQARRAWDEQWGVRDDAPGGREVGKFCRVLTEGPAPQPGDIDPLGLLAAEPGRFERRELDCAVLTALVLAVFARWDELHELLEGRVERVEQVYPGTWYIGPARVLWGIACAELARSRSGKQRRALMRQLAANISKLSGWAAEGGNFGHLAALLEAEHSVLDGDLERASRYYERARDSALAQQNPIYAAIASERLGGALAAAGHRRLAVGPLLDARERYQAWGAFAKVEALLEQWPELARIVSYAGSDRSESHDPTTTGSPSTSATANRALDTASLLKAAQTLAEDLRVPEVISRVMSIALENAGAQRGVLVLASKGELALAAEATVDETRAYLSAPPALAEVADRVPCSLLRYVHRTAEPLVLRTSDADSRFWSDPYFRALGERRDEGFSALCLPMIKRGRPVGLFYFENQLGAGAFGADRLELLHLLVGHAASALENARLYEHLRDSEIRWRSLVDQLPDYVILVRRDGGLEYVNALARPRQFSGFSFNEQQFVAGEHVESVEAAIARVFSTGAREELEAYIELSGSVPRWYAVRVAPIVIEGEIERVIVVATDIDDRKRAESERDQLEATLRQQQRLESVGTLASGVAHEINNPVQGIMNYAELIGSSEVADDMIREFADEIGHETQRVATIVRQLLAFSRQELGEAAEETALAEVVEGTVALIRAVMRHDQIALDIDVPKDLPKLVCRRQQIQQVIMNLVTNARDALNARWPGYHEDKQIRIGADTFEDEGEPWLRLIVEDRAGGVPPHIVAHIFDPFFTTKGRDHGTGLGLAVSHGIVSEHGGRLLLDNQPGVGAKFRVELPCSPRVGEAGEPW